MIKKRSLNGLFLKTNDHWIELFFTADFGVTSSAQVKVFDIEKGPKTTKIHEVRGVDPTIAADGDLTWKDPNNVNFVFNYGPYGPDRNAMLLKSDTLKMDLKASMPPNYESLYWVTPLNDEKT